MNTPTELRYAATHEWASREGELVRVGISDYAQEQLGDIVFVEFPEVGREVEQGEAFGVVESVKAVDDLCAPVTGEVVEVNEALDDQPELVNEDPYERGWIAVLKASAPEGLDALMDAAAYDAHCEEAESS